MALLLKQYQQNSLNTLTEYLKRARELKDPDVAFYEITRRQYRQLPAFPGPLAKRPVGPLGRPCDYPRNRAGHDDHNDGQKQDGANREAPYSPSHRLTTRLSRLPATSSRRKKAPMTNARMKTAPMSFAKPQIISIIATPASRRSSSPRRQLGRRSARPWCSTLGTFA